MGSGSSAVSKKLVKSGEFFFLRSASRAKKGVQTPARMSYMTERHLALLGVHQLLNAYDAAGCWLNKHVSGSDTRLVY